MRHFNRGLLYLSISFGVLWIAVPFIGVVINAVGKQSPTEGATWPTAFTLDNVIRAWTIGNFGVSLANSAIVGVSVGVGSVILSTLAAYGIEIIRPVGRNVMYFPFMIGLVLPAATYIIPLFYDIRGMGLEDTRQGVIFPLLAGSLAFGTFWMRAAFRSFPRTLLEAASVDGAGAFRTMMRVVVPLVRPAILTLLVLTFVASWNDFLLSLLVLSSPDNLTAPLSLALFVGKHGTDVSALSAGAILISLPVVIVFLVFQRSVVRGVLTGATKE